MANPEDISQGTNATPVNPANYNIIVDRINALGNRVFDVTDYGAVGDDSTDDAAAIQAAIDAAEAVLGAVFLPEATYKIESGLTIEAAISFIGANREGTIIKKYGDFDAITVDTPRPVLSGFTLDSNGTESSNGITVDNGPRGVFQRLWVKNQGNHGIEYKAGNLATFRDVITTTNAADGIKVNGASGCNNCSFESIDARSNVGIGLNFNAGSYHRGFAIDTQSNETGLRINTTGNYLFGVDSESNTTDIDITNHADTHSNAIFISGGNLTDNSAEKNFILNSTGSVASVMLAHLEGIYLENHTDGWVGRLEMTHTDDRVYNFLSSRSGADQTLNFANSVAGYVLKINMDGDLTITQPSPEVRLVNDTEEDGDGGRESSVRFKGEQSGGELTTLAMIRGSHDGAADDEKGQLEMLVNDTNDGNSPSKVGIKIISDGGVYMANLKSGATQGAAGAAAGELWHDTDDETIKLGV